MALSVDWKESDFCATGLLIPAPPTFFCWTAEMADNEDGETLGTTAGVGVVCDVNS